MRNSTGTEIRTINERFEQRETAKKLAIELERASACLANAERLAGPLAVEGGLFLAEELNDLGTQTAALSHAVQKFLKENANA